MKTAVTAIRMIVGTLFVLSGAIKANDPLGLSYKMEEFFEIWTASLPSSSFLSKALLQLHDHTLLLSVSMIGLEIMAGVALLIGWKRKAVLNLLLLLILFFTFLTAYAYWSGKFKNCGCFGDCLPITPFTSFVKDIGLLLMILFLVWKRNEIRPIFEPRKQIAVLLFSLLFTVALQWYVLAYLPLADCLPFKKNNNIAQQMKIPANAVTDSFAMKFIYEKEGKKFEFAPEELPADLSTYQFIDRKQELVRKGNAEPPIKGFSLMGLNGQDFTQSVLAEPKTVIVFVLDFEDTNEWISQFGKLYNESKKRNIPLFVVSSHANKGKIIFAGMGHPDVVFLSSDQTAIRTAARTNPTVYLLQKGTVVEKQSFLKTDYLINKL